MFFIAGEERVAEMELSDDAGEAPDIDLMVIGDPEDYFWGAVVAALDIGVDGLFFEAA